MVKKKSGWNTNKTIVTVVIALVVLFVVAFSYQSSKVEDEEEEGLRTGGMGSIITEFFTNFFGKGKKPKNTQPEPVQETEENFRGYYLSSEGWNPLTTGCGYTFLIKENCEKFIAAQQKEEPGPKPEGFHLESCYGRIEQNNKGEIMEVDDKKLYEEPAKGEINLTIPKMTCKLVGLESNVGTSSRGIDCKEHCKNEVGVCTFVKNACVYRIYEPTTIFGPDIVIVKLPSARCDCNPPNNQ